MDSSPKSLLFILCLGIATGFSSSAEVRAPTKNLEADLGDVLKVLMSKFMPAFTEQITSPELSVPCSASLLKMYFGLRNKDAWAIRMVLSNGLLPNNILEGSVVNLGSYEQCLKTRAYNQLGQVHFKGQYCTLRIVPNKERLARIVSRFQAIGELTGRFSPLTRTTHAKFASQNFRTGLCTPSACTTRDLNHFMSTVLGQYGANGTVTGCRTDDPKTITALQATSIAILGTLVFTVALATVAEWVIETRTAGGKKFKGKISSHSGISLKMLLFFSAISNTRHLLRTENTEKNKPLLFLGGFKVILIFWVIYGHAFIMVQLEFAHSVFAIGDVTGKVASQVIPNGFLSVSTFLFLSGFALTYAVLCSRQALLKQNLVIVFFIGLAKRYFRLTFPIIGVILCTFILPLLVDGPADQDFFASEVNGCINRWWTVFVHINNFNPMDNMCLQHLWYVSADMQIFLVVALPLTLVFIKHPKIAFVISCIVALVFCVLTTLQIYFWDIAYAMTLGTNDQKKTFQSLEFIYYRPFTHVGTYVLGLITGYLAFDHKKSTIHPVIKASQWLLSIALASFVMFVTVPWNRGHLPSDVINAVYGGFHRLIWAAALVWPSYACATGHGGILNGFFSWKALRPISRLTYCIYLVHLWFFLIKMGNLKTNFDLAEYLQLMRSLGIFCYSIFFGYLLFLCFECPGFHIQKMIFDRPRPKKYQEKKSICENGAEKSHL
ncbi:unnamed protein product [Ixodes hexagonus]